jgi:competence protein ComEC
MNPLWQEVLRVAKEKNVQIKNIEQVGEINFNDGVKIKILFPVKNMNGIENGNDASIVTQVIHGRNKILLTGDLPQTSELFLVSLYGENLKSDILKLGHHGSDTSTHTEFLAKVKPQVGVVSAGKDNTFGHPHRSVIELLEKFKIDVLETAKEGNINFESDGINMWRE